ncbi:simple sugar transport system ATP-binding protein [Agrobacterium larrymoorei]|uniref:Simple sugar transport system ATP-binding protein n=1 Tax=Agrobacterium larrymoorei TaxID=160699 RepID=A0AAJ2BG56_9HYPH|nr:sugar ABC transporter ATP-binding protein [Agrobacterium larrymoorei]MDR6102229.1 simple sugar transport system ATP-binding protein [Agrobacterium larrymoorei]
MAPFLSLQKISKTFSGVHALRDVDFDIEPGEVLCLLGENGSGKSTLIKTLSGMHKPDSGSILLRGEPQENWGPEQALSAGIEVIYQDFSLFPNLSVMENIGLAEAAGKRRWFASWGTMRRRAKAALARIGTDIPLDKPAEELSVAQRQLVAIARALVGNPSLIVMDEPTSALTLREIGRLLDIIEQLRADGVAVIFVSHKLDEVQRVAQRVIVMRNGEKVHDERAREFDRAALVHRMVGVDIPQDRRDTKTTEGPVVLEVSGLQRANYYRNISFSLREGEILGLTGQLDSGRTALALSLYGMLPPDAGRVVLDGKPVAVDSIRHALASGIGMVPEDRLTEGLFLSRSVGTNLAAGSLSSLSGAFGIIDEDRVDSFGRDWISRLSIKTPNADAMVHTLSGGNQQRVVLGKVLARKPRVVVLNGPTVGVDVGSKEEIHRIIEAMSAEGAGVIVVSDDTDEIIRLCDRLLVMSEGEIVETIAGAELDATRLSTLGKEV